MNIERADALWPDERAEITIEELAELSGLSNEVLLELVNFGVLVPAEAHAARWTFTAECVTTVQIARRLREDFDLDANALALALRLLDRIRELEDQVRELRARR